MHTPDVFDCKSTLKSHLLEFNMDALNDARVKLSLEEDRMFEVVIGGWGNKHEVGSPRPAHHKAFRWHCSGCLRIQEVVHKTGQMRFFPY
jgi:hypothetical protein